MSEQPCCGNACKPKISESCNSDISNKGKTPSPTLDTAPDTEAPDGSALALKGVGQFHITCGWIVGIIFLTLGLLISPRGGGDTLLIGIFTIVAIFAVVTGYMRGAKAKAIAVAAINAKKAAERSARMEQMIVNMVGGNSHVTATPAVSQIDCPKCGAKIPAATKFCPECGAQTTAICAKCGASLASGVKFCPECGAQTTAICAKCGASLASGVKFCPECGWQTI